MASELICETCGLSVPPDTAVCPRDGTVVLTSFHVPNAAREEPKVVVHASETPATDAGARDPLIGLKLGEYELRARIGVGGMGLVYEGIQPLIGKRVAVKVLRPELAHSTEQVERLLAEARAVNAIRHRGIIDIFGFGQVPDGRQYIVMEYLEGQALDAVLAEKNRLPVSEALTLLDEVLAALAAAHGAGVVHRDLKPSNIFLVRQPDGSRYVKVLDFGLAKRAQTPTGRSAQTRTDMVVGTPEYMAPEQARGQEVGPMTDLYALGVVTFEVVTGRLPFIGTSPVDLLMKHVEARPPRPSEFVPELPPALDAFILQMLTKDPETRPSSADALRQQLHKLRRTLRSTRSNSNALAPVPVEKPRPRDDVDSRRPTTPVPVPPDLKQELTSQELRAAGVSPRGNRRVPVAAAIGAAVLLLGGGAAFIVGSLGDDAPAAPKTASTASPAETKSAGSAPGATAVGTAAVANAVPGDDTAPGAAVAAMPGGSTDSDANAALAPADGASATPAPEPSKATPTTVADAAPGGSARVAESTTSRRKSRSKTSENVTESPDEPRAVSGSVARPNALQRRIDTLESRLSTRVAAGQIPEAKAETAYNMLDKYRGEARTAGSAQRQKISEGLDYLERTYLKR